MVDANDTSDNWCRAWESRRLVEALLNKLPQRTRTALGYRYGLGESKTPLTQQQTGRKLGVDGTRIGQMERAALHQLRSFLFSLE